MSKKKRRAREQEEWHYGFDSGHALARADEATMAPLLAGLRASLAVLDQRVTALLAREDGRLDGEMRAAEHVRLLEASHDQIEGRLDRLEEAFLRESGELCPICGTRHLPSRACPKVRALGTGNGHMRLAQTRKED